MPASGFTNKIIMSSAATDPFESHQNALKAVLKQNLSIARQVRRITQDELALRSGVSRTTIIQLEKGEGDPKLSTVVSLAIVLGIAPVLLLFGLDEMKAVQRLVENPPNAEQVAEAQVRTMGQLLKAGFSRASRSAEGDLAQDNAPTGGAAIGAAVGSMLLPGMGTPLGAMLGAMLERTMDTSIVSPAVAGSPLIDPAELALAIKELGAKSPRMKMRLEMLRLSRNEKRPVDEIARLYGLTDDEVQTHLRIALAKFYEWKKEAAGTPLPRETS